MCRRSLAPPPPLFRNKGLLWWNGWIKTVQRQLPWKRAVVVVDQTEEDCAEIGSDSVNLERRILNEEERRLESGSHRTHRRYLAGRRTTAPDVNRETTKAPPQKT
ncbi:hypothetical protein E3N88_32584 [Mikania micrantha]|uniref:Uncharacterized protein n=1 Tax=Mikania micrantha TaxID=192012 RepID=A0A5N6M8W2_9ASTR|nr:hypothetical protein E3N88_32584 [Mikania micrantha]